MSGLKLLHLNSESVIYQHFKQFYIHYAQAYVTLGQDKRDYWTFYRYLSYRCTDYKTLQNGRDCHIYSYNMLIKYPKRKNCKTFHEAVKLN